MKEKIVNMILLQKSLNDSTNGEGWEKGISVKTGKIINWWRCANQECAELVDSFNWKHWKDINLETDKDNIKIETVDIWHFILSELIASKGANNKKEVDRLADNINTVFSNDNYFFYSQIPENNSPMEVKIKKAEELQLVLLRKETEKLLNTFKEMAIEYEVDFILMYKLYIGKNILNRFRQENGYKDGTYIKIWNDKKNLEDNVYMQHILDKYENIEPDQLLNLLNKAYLKVKEHGKIDMQNLTIN